MLHGDMGHAPLIIFLPAAWATLGKMASVLHLNVVCISDFYFFFPFLGAFKVLKRDRS